MGKVIISAKIENLFDIEEVFKGQITDDEVRRLEIDDAMVDTGATTLSLPKRLIAELGLRQLRTGHLQAPVGKMLVAAVCSLSHGATRSRKCIKVITDVSSRQPSPWFAGS